MEFDRIDEMISSEDPSLRREAATLLADIGGDEALDRLEGLLKDRNSGVRDAAQNSIVILGGRTAIMKMVPLLTVEDAGIRNAAIDILRKIGIDGTDILHAIAKDPDDNVRLFVLDILGSIGSHESLSTLIEGLYDANANVRNAAVISLGELGSEESFDHLKKLINDEEWIRFSVIESLARIHHADVVPFLLEELSRWSSDEITVCAILETLGRIGSPDSIRPLISMLEKADGYVELAISQTLLKIMSDRDVESLTPSDRGLLKGILEAHLQDADEEFLHDMLQMLGLIGDASSAESIIAFAAKVDPCGEPDTWEDVKAALVRLCRPALLVRHLDGDEQIRMLAADILAEIGGAKEAKEISKRIFSTDGYVKRAMADALARIGGAGARKTLLKLVHDADGHVITSSLSALGEIGNPADISKMMGFLKHPYPDVRGVALDAIARIGTEKAETCFLELSRDEDPKVRIIGLAGLEKTGSARLPQVATYMLKDLDWEARMAAARVIKDAGLPIENDGLLVLLNDEHDEIRHLAIDIVGARRIAPLRSFVEEAIGCGEMWTAYHAIEALGQFRDEDAKERLLGLLESSPDFLRISAVKALGGWEDEALASELEVYLDDDNLDVARAVAEAVDRLQGVSF
ncbi:MAG TPA: HEAT repeat domain-containing protein [Deltaproteobacteria bacterium]|nr:HEAT repeat domain-containing protein [Deltaproteobacteria bacterium]HOI07947.1 HEAT repeat domain-containing protein [Deltaproteobacteria bacterium]